jgi:DNA-binding MarR family transcriptional regulator
MHFDATAETLRALRRLVRALRLADRAAEVRFGVSAAQLFVLEQLAAEPLRSLSELAERTMTDASSVSVVVQKLTDQGLVVRAIDPQDARRSTLRLSAAGRRLLARAPASPQSRVISAVEAMPPSQRRQLATLLDRLGRQMRLDPGEPPMFFEGEPRRALARRRRAAPRRKQRSG